MFSPGADVSPYGPPSSSAKPDPKFITHASTRLPSQEGESSRGVASEPPSPTHSRINAAIAGTPYRPRSPNSRSAFPLLASLPSPTPAELGPDAVKQLMTMGTLAATPRILSSGDDDIPEPNTPFHIAPPTARERISHKLSNKAAKSLKEKAMQLSGATPRSTVRGSMAPPEATPRRVAAAAGNLTPAAKRLLDRTTMGTRRAEAMEKKAAWERSHKGDTDLSRVRWTPSPAVRK
jgi:protein DGCR14